MPHDCAFVVRGVSEANYSGGYASMEWCSESRLQIFHGVSRGAGVKESLGRRFLDIEECWGSESLWVKTRVVSVDVRCGF